MLGKTGLLASLFGETEDNWSHCVGEDRESLEFVLGRQDHWSHCIQEIESLETLFGGRGSLGSLCLGSGGSLSLGKIGSLESLCWGKQRIIGDIVFGESRGSFESLCRKEIQNHCVIEVRGSLMLFCWGKNRAVLSGCCIEEHVLLE